MNALTTHKSYGEITIDILFSLLVKLNHHLFLISEFYLLIITLIALNQHGSKSTEHNLCLNLDHQQIHNINH